jgi:hypothetical protein
MSPEYSRVLAVVQLLPKRPSVDDSKQTPATGSYSWPLALAHEAWLSTSLFIVLVAASRLWMLETADDKPALVALDRPLSVLFIMLTAEERLAFSPTAREIVAMVLCMVAIVDCNCETVADS